jgi:DNA-binding beta-propeller fold protein YncE
MPSGNRGGHRPTRSAALLMLIAILSYPSSAFVSIRQETQQASTLKDARFAQPDATAVVHSPTRAKSHTVLVGTHSASPAIAPIRASLVQVTDTSQFSPPSPDPAGITYIPPADMLLISDSEVNETRFYTGNNLFHVLLSGDLIDTSNTLASSWLSTLSKGPLLSEPTGLAFNPANGHLFITDDQALRIFDMNPGTDEIHGTQDDIITSFYRATDFGSADPEGVAYDSRQKRLYVADGPPGRVFEIDAGANGFFDRPPPLGDDQVVELDTESMGLHDPEGIDLNPSSGTLYVVGRGLDAVLEMTTSGKLVRIIDVSFLNPRALAGVTHGPGSMNPTVMSLYITDRGADNNVEPGENDGKIYEISLSPLLAEPTDSRETAVAFAEPVPTPAPQPTPEPKPEVEPVPMSEPAVVTYRVVPGDTLSEIAARYATSVAALMAANPIIEQPSLIQSGWQLTIPPIAGE